MSQKGHEAGMRGAGQAVSFSSPWLPSGKLVSWRELPEELLPAQRRAEAYMQGGGSSGSFRALAAVIQVGLKRYALFPSAVWHVSFWLAALQGGGNAGSKADRGQESAFGCRQRMSKHSVQRHTLFAMFLADAGTSGVCAFL